MPTVFEKLNLKDHNTLLVVNAPESFEAALASLSGVTIVRESAAIDAIEFALAFVTQQDALDRLAEAIAAKTQGDALVWFAYPKSTSKKYSCEFNRDTGWSKLGELGFEGVRQVAIDDDWSALRFRRVEYIKSLKREEKRAMTDEGKKRTKKEG